MVCGCGSGLCIEGERGKGREVGGWVGGWWWCREELGVEGLGGGMEVGGRGEGRWRRRGGRRCGGGADG